MGVMMEPASEFAEGIYESNEDSYVKTESAPANPGESEKITLHARNSPGGLTELRVRRSSLTRFIAAVRVPEKWHM